MFFDQANKERMGMTAEGMVADLPEVCAINDIVLEIFREMFFVNSDALPHPDNRDILWKELLYRKKIYITLNNTSRFINNMCNTHRVFKEFTRKYALKHFRKIRRRDKLLYVLLNAPVWIRTDKEVVLQAIYNDGIAFKVVNNNFKRDKMVASVALLMNPDAFKYTPKEIKCDENFMDYKRCLEAKTNVDSLFWSKSVPDSLINDREIMHAIVYVRGIELKYISERLQDDLSIVMTAVKQNVGALKYASPRLQDDPRIVKEAARLYPDVMKSAAAKLI